MGKAQFRVVGPVAIGSILFKGMLVEFLIDSTDLEKVKPLRWHYTTNGYIATSVKEVVAAPPTTQDLSGAAAATAPQPAKKRELYLQNFLLPPGPNQVVSLLTKNGLDCRRKNLSLVAASTTSPSQASKKRSIELPPMCGVAPEEIPKHIWYVQANGYHRDRFAIEFKSEGILWKSSSSKLLSLREKLDQAKLKLEEFYQKFPHLDPKQDEDRSAELNSTFEALLKGPALPQAAP